MKNVHIPKIELPETGWADRLMESIIWGRSAFNPRYREPMEMEDEVVEKKEVDEYDNLLD